MLEPLAPEQAAQDYLSGRTDLTQSSKENHKYRLRRFTEWCAENDIENLNNLNGRHLHRYKVWRAEDVNNVTLKNQLGTVRVFLRFCEKMDAVQEGLSEKLELPELGIDEDVDDTAITAEEAEAILNYLEKFEYASLRHVIFSLLWHTGVRTSTLYAFDVDDFSPEGEYIEAIHRPQSGTPLKNKERGEREINLSTEVTAVISDYIDRTHPGVKDGKDRLPLIGTSAGRAHKTTIRENIYRVTRPCHYTNECPHNRTQDDCKAAQSKHASKCPSSVSPHAIRKGSITYHRNTGWPAQAVSDRANVSQEVLEKHYDKGTPSQKRKRRKEFLDRL